MIAHDDIGRPNGAPRVILTERKGLALASVAAFKGQAALVAAALNARFGLTPPSKPRIAANESLALAWLGPDQWLAMAESGDLAALMVETLGALAAVTDQSDGWVVLRLSGPNARDVLTKCLTIDLDPRVFQPGDVALTRAGHVDVRVWQGAAGVYEIACARSYAGGLFGWLEESALEFGLSRPG
jgi:sarcosine oxidase subunit gamma